jgi:adenine-specific DNA-methyltransferase
MSTVAINTNKLRGGYYTRNDVARWLSRWAIQSSTDRVLEPSCGDGVFLAAACETLGSFKGASKLKKNQVVGVELIPEEADKARLKNTAIASGIVSGDFFSWLEENASSPKFDVVLGNPPFIRYQNFPESSRSLAMNYMQSKGLRPNRLTNMWVPFVVAAISLLKEGGRLAMVIPAELLQVTYAGQLRQYFADSFQRVTIYACNEMFFENAEQEVVLLLAEGKLAKADSSNACDISLVEAATISELLKFEPQAKRKSFRPKLVQHDSEKWLKYFLDADEIDFMRALRTNGAICDLSEHCSVDVGVVTGNNEFFVLDQEQVQAFELEDFIVPLVGRSSHLSGAVIDKAELRSLSTKGNRVHLLRLTDQLPEDFSKGLKRHIAAGEEKGVHLGYKCSIRKPWYKVPAVWEPDCFFFRQIYDFPRVVLNKAKATSTDTIHRMRCASPAKKVASNLYTHLTAASAEIEGRSYGGGVLELEPTEAERLLFPKVLNGAMPIDEADKLIREGKLDTVLEHNDKLVLQQSLGLTESDCQLLKQIWTKMRNRRLARRRSKRD